MGIQGNKATHDFLSLYAAAAAKDSSLHDSKPPAASQGFFLKTHDFLQPLEKPAPAASGVGRQQQPQQQTKHALPGGIGTFSISPVPGARPVVVKPEPPLVLWGQPTTTHPTAQELAVRVDGKGGSCSGSGTDQRPNTPKSKHSATEQRRRSKINDRFQILRDLLPHTDQKRDKATFLLEVIEYIRFLQEKAQKYEASFPEWNQENAKLLPWSNIYFRSSWKSAQSKGQIPEDALPDPSQFVTNGSSPGFNITGKLDDNHTTVASGAVAGTPDLAENDHMASVSCRSAETPINITNNVTSQYQPQWAGPSGVDDCAVNSSMLNDQQLTIDEGTISVSSQYSQELLNTLTHALQSSGIDLSQANISVQINLGKRAVKRSVAGQSSSSKELTDPDPSNEMVAAEELPHATKRHKSGNT
ncbi:transcription factor BIM2 isoform X3 [Brachypodium distachyon]|uniref:transcription factor BIM2 isoform X3 n=1 Tax=Brachypodium distachyon TaxID=15368 RepID=UPI0001C711D6|nr:transcription factor BIM2 isoform X3 [Brachypodium distachyon]|eukprot:XP_024310602.1 transcription factor BIM2 isoform X3 [Brachypodium distachyon]